jgi:DNA repair protein RecO (recombination protein O)
VTHKTKGIVLKTVKYGETSIIVHIYTELFGLQSYLINGVRSSGKKGTGKANLFQPGSLLELVVYHNELKNLQRVKEFRWAVLYKEILSDVVKNSVVLFMVELLYKTIKQPETNMQLFEFIEDALLKLDESEASVVANYPLFFALHLTEFFGFRISDDFSEKNAVLDLREGEFISDKPTHPYFLEDTLSYITSQLLRVRQPHELTQIPLKQETRRTLLHAYETFYALHISDFGTMKTLPVLQAVLG